MEQYEIDSLAESIRWEGYAFSRHVIEGTEVANLDEYRNFIKELGANLNDADPLTKPAHMLLQLAVISNLVSILPRSQIPVDYLVGIEQAIRHANIYPSRLAAIKQKLLKPLSMIFPFVLGYFVYSQGNGLTWSLATFAASGFFLARWYLKALTGIVVESSIDCKSLFQFLWENGLVAIYDITNKHTYDRHSVDNWTNALATIIR